MIKEALFPPELPRPRVAYSPAIKAGPFVFVSGQLASDLNTRTRPSIHAFRTTVPRLRGRRATSAKTSTPVCAPAARDWNTSCT